MKKTIETILSVIGYLTLGFFIGSALMIVINTIFY